MWKHEQERAAMLLAAVEEDLASQRMAGGDGRGAQSRGNATAPSDDGMPRVREAEPGPSSAPRADDEAHRLADASQAAEKDKGSDGIQAAVSVNSAGQPGCSNAGAPEDAVWHSGDIYIRQYQSENDLQVVMDLIDKELSEPYSIFTYRYFIYNWPNLCYLAINSSTGHAFGTVVCKLDNHRGMERGYLAMLTVEKEYRGRQIGTQLVRMSIDEMIRCGAEEVVLEAEVTNKGALALYQNLGFIRDKRLFRYYLNGVDAYRLKLLVPHEVVMMHAEARENEGGFDLVDFTGMEPAVQSLRV